MLTREQAIRYLSKQGYFESDDSFASNISYFQTTHLGPDGKPLTPTGNLDEPTSWALQNPVGDAQKSNLEPAIQSGLETKRKAILEKALGEHAKNVKEEPNGSNRSKDIDKYFPKWLINGLEKQEAGPAWCAFFVNWVVAQVLGKYPWKGCFGSCKRLVEAAQKSPECTVFADPKLAAPGDVFVILYGLTGHTGFVLRKNEQNTKINTVEGNCGNRVKVGLRETKDITWYIRICPQIEDTSSTLLAATNVSAAGTR